MSYMNSRQREALDRHITGNYGEDQFRDAPDDDYCDAHAYVRDDETTLDDPYAAREAAANDCPECQALRRPKDVSSMGEGPEIASTVELPPPSVLSRTPLVGIDSNAFQVIGVVSAGLRRQGATREQVKSFQDEAMAGDYNHVIATAMRWTDPDYLVEAPERDPITREDWS